MSKSVHRVQIPMDVAYGALSLFTTVLHNIFLLFHVDMFVSVYKIDKTSFWVGEIVFLIWNSLNDPLFGWISDRKYLSSSVGKDHTKANIIQKRIGALRWTGPLFAISFLSFWVPWTYASVQFVVCLCLYDGFLTMVDLHHSALLADLAVSADTRTKLNSRSSLFSIIGTASVFISYSVWNKDNLSSFRLFCLCLTLISLVGFWSITAFLRQIFRDQSKQLAPITDNQSRYGTSLFLALVLLNKLSGISIVVSFLWDILLQTVQTQIRHCRMQCLIRIFTVCLQNILLKIENGLVQLLRVGNSILLIWVIYDLL